MKYLSNKKGFLGIDNKFNIKENVVVVPFGLEKTVSYVGGTKKGPKDSAIQRAAKRAGISTNKRRGLFNSLDEADVQNLIVHVQDITKDMIKAIKKNDQRTVDGLYKNLGKVIKWKVLINIMKAGSIKKKKKIQIMKNWKKK